MPLKKVVTTLQEDFEAIGMRPTVRNAQPAADAGADPIDGPVVTRELFERINALPFANLSAADCEALIEELRTKELPEGDAELAKLAEEVVRRLLSEVKAKQIRRFKKRGMSKKRSFQCPKGYAKDPKNPRRCIRKARGKLAKERREKKLYARSGKGKKAARVSKRMQARREDFSPFAMELHGLLEDTRQEQMDVRGEIMDRVSRLLGLLQEDFDDVSVDKILEDAYAPLRAAWDAGRLDEATMAEDAFLAEVKPVIALISKALERIGDEERGLGK